MPVTAVGRKLNSMASGLGRGLSSIGSSRAGMAAVGLGAFGLGAANVIGPAARDAAFQAAFDDPNADIAFTGRKFDSRYLLGGAIGGPIGTTMQLSSLDDYFTENPLLPGPFSPQRAAAGGAVGGLIGGIAGAAIGRPLLGATLGAGAGVTAGSGTAGLAVGGGFGAAVGLTSLGTGIYEGYKRGKTLKGALIGGGVGAVLGMGVVGGTVAATAGPVRNYVNDNRRFFDQSPYAGRTSANIANSLNASGDIVLGMHNSRRGY